MFVFPAANENLIAFNRVLWVLWTQLTSAAWHAATVVHVTVGEIVFLYYCWQRFWRLQSHLRHFSGWRGLLKEIVFNFIRFFLQLHFGISAAPIITALDNCLVAVAFSTYSLSLASVTKKVKCMKPEASSWVVWLFSLFPSVVVRPPASSLVAVASLAMGLL